MLSFAVLLLSLLCIVGRGGAQPFTDGCDTRIIQSCPTSGLVAYFEADIILPPGAFLDHHCKSVLEFVDCVQAFILSCPKREYSAFPFSSYDGMVDTLKKLCDKESQMQADYEPLVPCANNKENGFRDMIIKAFTNIRDFIEVRTSNFQAEPTEELQKEITCILLRTQVPELMYAFFEKCGNLVNVTFYETNTTYFNAIENICPAVAGDSDMNVIQTTWMEEPYLTTTTQEYYENATTTDGVAFSETYLVNCTDDPVLPHQIQWITEQLSGSLIPYPEVLRDRCGRLVTETQRLLRYQAKCGARHFTGAGDAPNPYHNYMDLLPVFEQLCNNESSLWQDYEKYSPCIKRQEGFFTSIIDIANADLNYFATYVAQQNFSGVRIRAARAQICIIRAVYMPMVLDIVQDQCSIDSAAYLKRLMDNFLHPVERYCPNGITYLYEMSEMYVRYRLQLLENVMPTLPPL